MTGDAEPQGTDPDIATGTITILTGGIYSVEFTTTNTAVPNNAEYDMYLTRNGIAGPVGGEVEPGNQAERLTLTFGGIVQYFRGDVVAVEALSTSGDDWLSSYAQFMVYRISDSND